MSLQEKLCIHFYKTKYFFDSHSLHLHFDSLWGYEKLFSEKNRSYTGTGKGCGSVKLFVTSVVPLVHAFSKHGKCMALGH